MQTSLLTLRKIELFVPGTPRTQGSLVPFWHAGLQMCKVKPEHEPELEAWRKLIAAYGRQRWAGEPTANPVQLDTVFYFGRVKLTAAGPRNLKGVYPTNRMVGDTDKFRRAVQDALTGVLYVDDSQVCKGWEEKRFVAGVEREGVLIVMEELPNE